MALTKTLRKKAEAPVEVFRDKYGLNAQESAIYARVCARIELGMSVANAMSAEGQAATNLHSKVAKNPNIKAAFEMARALGMQRQLETIDQCEDWKEDRMKFEKSAWMLSHCHPKDFGSHPEAPRTLIQMVNGVSPEMLERLQKRGLLFNSEKNAEATAETPAIDAVTVDAGTGGKDSPIPADAG